MGPRPPLADCRFRASRSVGVPRTRRTAAYAIDVISEDDGALRAGFQAMTFRTGRWHLDEDAWPEEWRATH